MRNNIFRGVIISLLIVGGVTVSTNTTYAAGLTVNSSGDATADDGACTLREAITAANTDTASGATPGECIAGSGADTINFNISGSGIHRITPTIQLPTITETLNIDGTTQPGTSCEPRDLKIEIDSTTAYATGAYMNTMVFNSDNNILQGIATFGEPDDLPNNGSADSGVIFNGAGSVVRCNNFGITADNKSPSTELGYVNNLGDLRFTAYADSSYIGGTTAGDRNVFGDTNIGLNVDCGNINNRPEGLKVFGNYFGTDVTGTAPYSNREVDVSMSCGENIQIGSANSNERNIFAGSPIRGASIVLAPASSSGAGIVGTRIQGNYFGLDPSGVARPGFASAHLAVHLISFPAAALGGTDSNNHQNLVGGTNPGEANVITGFPVGVMSVASFFDFGGGPMYSTMPVNDNTIIGNKIYDNDFGIELCGDLNILTTDFCGSMAGPNPNDSGDPDTGANDYLNKPEITAIKQVGNQITFTYDLDVIGSPSDQYRIEFFSNDTADTHGYGQGQNMLGAKTITASGTVTGRQATFTLPTDGDITSKVFAATTTVVDESLTYGFGSTSEFGTVVDGATVNYAPATSGGNPGQSEAGLGSDDQDVGKLADTGTNYWALTIASSLLISASASIIFRKSGRIYKLIE